jgi:hypothetical protein
VVKKASKLRQMQTALLFNVTLNYKFFNRNTLKERNAPAKALFFIHKFPSTKTDEAA